jgi:enoyl-CoA hydratase/carnithine racemase
MQSGPPVLFVRSGLTARVTLSRASQRNAVDLPMCLMLRDCFENVDSDPATRVVLLEAEGSVFCGGADLKERQDKDAQWVRRRRLAAFAAYSAIERCSKPVVALVQGPAIGSGCEMALACDFIVATSNATFRFPEPQWGTIGATQRLQRAVGARLAKDLLFTGRTLAAKEALSCGLISRIVDPDQLAETGRDIADSIAAAPELAIRLTKQAVDLGGRTDLDAGIRIELAEIDHNLTGGVWWGGIDGFLESHQKKT